MLPENEFEHVLRHSVESVESQNVLIQGDNGACLPLLLASYEGTIKCIYIDPPYNNGENYFHFSDDREHQAWLDELTQTLTYLKPFLAEDGSIWISIDDSEMHYLKVAADRVFGRKNFVTTIVWQQRTTRENRKVFSNNHEYLLVYTKNPVAFRKSRNLLASTGDLLKRYRNPDKDPRGPWQSISANVQAGHATPSQFYDVVAPNGKKHSPPNGRCWVYNEARMNEEIGKGNIWFGLSGNNVPRIKKFLRDSKQGLTPETLWLAQFAKTNRSAKEHLLQLFPDETPFDTPKPEELIYNILHIATNSGDIVLDCFAGSGSTLSTAHKMGRRYVGIEIGDHAVSLAAERLRKVTEGEQGGISRQLQWNGGGGFRFYRARNELEVNRARA